MHPEIQSHFTHQVLLRQADEDHLTNLCREPLHQDVLCKYQEFLQRDIASHDVYGVHKQEQQRQESKIYGVPVVRDMPINCYHIPHSDVQTSSPTGLLKPGEVADNQIHNGYIGMPIPVAFDKDLGLKKKHTHAEVHLSSESKSKLAVPRCTCRKQPVHYHKGCKVSTSKQCVLHPITEVPHHKKVSNILESRKKISSCYTKVDPEIRRKVQADIDRRSRPAPKCDQWEPNKYVIEQIRPSHSFDKSKVSSKRAKISMSTERVPRFTDNSSENTIRKLTQMVELMDQALREPARPVNPAPPVTKGPPSATTEDTVPKPADMPEPKPAVKPAARKPEPPAPKQPAARPPIVKTPAPKPPSSFVAVGHPPRTVKEVSRTPKTVRVVERTYELDRDSFEISEIVNHVPSRVSSLSAPVVKIARKIQKDEDLQLFDRELYTPLDCELVDEHVAELEKRNVYTRTLKDVQIPVLYNHSVNLR